VRADDPSVTLEAEAPLVELVVHVYGATLGENWSGFPTVMAPDYGVFTSGLEHLDATFPVYLDYEMTIRFGSCNLGVRASLRRLRTPPLMLWEMRIGSKATRTSSS
jgi:hypothetical protein